jgi:hypothetical protein
VILDIPAQEMRQTNAISRENRTCTTSETEFRMRIEQTSPDKMQ